MKINRYWYSKKQEQVAIQLNRFVERYVLVNGKWHEYTEWTTSLDGKSN